MQSLVFGSSPRPDNAGSLMTREEAVRLLNSLANQSANLDALGYEWVDLSRFFDRPGNIAIGDERGVMLFAHIGGGVYDTHYLFHPKVRGREALRLARNIITRLFTLHGAKAIVGQVPTTNKASRAFSRALGCTRLGTSVNSDGRSCVNYRLERSQWAALSAESLAVSGRPRRLRNKRRPRVKPPSSPSPVSTT